MAPIRTNKGKHSKDIIISSGTGCNPALKKRIAHLALPLAPLVQVTTGQIHPWFPRSVLHYHLLTDGELEELAHFYHQRTPCAWSAYYPNPVGWRRGLSTEEKRRKFGRFMGLRGCESPVGVGGGRTEEELQEELWREARAARAKEDEDEMWRRKREWYY